jgi:hypothetical protein
MKFNFIIFSCILFLVTKSNCQTAVIKVDKTEFRLEEEIKIIFEIDAKIDSATTVHLDEFNIISGPQDSQSTSTVNSETNYKKTTAYTITPKYPGIFTIESPQYSVQGKLITSNPVTITVENLKLTDVEKRLADLKKYAQSFKKDEGTVRFVVSGDVGYVEEFQNGKWAFIRALSNIEILQIGRK